MYSPPRKTSIIAAIPRLCFFLFTQAYMNPKIREIIQNAKPKHIMHRTASINSTRKNKVLLCPWNVASYWGRLFQNNDVVS